MLRWLLILIVVITCSLNLGYANERYDGGYFTIVDEKTGEEIFSTAIMVRKGDEYITSDNKRYEVSNITGNIVKAKFIGNVKLNSYLAPSKNYANWPSLLQPRIAQAEEVKNGKVAIYHTHSDESYVPTDGVESKLGDGSIYKVGDAFANSLKNNGIEVVHSMTKHDPHDNGAYERSRRTMAELVKQQPAAVFDVHRDAVPPNVYSGNINGEEVTKIQMVVGKYGPTAKQAEDYALQLKAASDQMYPELVKGIYFAKGGDYNQDLHPRAMLLEVGAHTNSLEEAERGIALFGNVMPTVVGTAQQTQPQGAQIPTSVAGVTETMSSGAMKSVGIIIGILVIGAIAFMVISTGGMKEAKDKIKNFKDNEFTNFFGPSPKKMKKKKQDDKRRDEE